MGNSRLHHFLCILLLTLTCSGAFTDTNYENSLPPSEDTHTVKQRLVRLRQHLESNLIEQPEVIEALYNWEYETAVMGEGKATKPSIMVLMGTPGTGKDTAVKTYSNAQYMEEVKSIVGEEHFIRIDTQKTARDAWTLLGSATGYVGSQELPPLVRFLVEHSGGKYRISRTFRPGGMFEKVVLNNPDSPWNLFRSKQKSYPSSKGIVFLNEFQHWSQEAKDVILKDFLENGILRLNSPNGGVTHLQVPGIRFIIATNEGSELLTNKDANGTTYGNSPTYEEMLDRYERTYQDKALLRKVLADASSRVPANAQPEERTGTSDAILSRISLSNFILMRPPSPEGLQKIIRIKERLFNNQLTEAEKGMFGPFKIRLSEDLVRFIQQYDYVAADGGRGVENKFQSMVKSPLFQIIEENDIKRADVQEGFYLDVKQNSDKTYSLTVAKGLEADTPFAESIIKDTIKERDYHPISDERIIELSKVGEKLSQQVFNATNVAELLGKAVLISEESRHVKKAKWSDHQSATTFAFFGLSSTGKSEMVKALVKILYPKEGESKRADIDGNKIKTDYDMKTFIWGNGKEASEFMRLYDRNRGHFVLVLEEVSNIPKELLKSLYDLLREAHPKFSDSIDRPMTNVTIILTGNTGANWYDGVPMDLPLEVRMAAWARIYNESVKVPEFLRSSMNEHLPEPLTNRIGLANVSWFAPHTFQSIHELAILKIGTAFENLKSNGSRRGWNIGFRSEEDKNRFIEIVKREGFNLYEQGASLHHYAKQIEDGLRYVLLTNQVPSSTKVAIVPRDNQTEEVLKKQNAVFYDILVEGQSQPLELKTTIQERKQYPKINLTDQKIVAAHEAAHEIVGRALLADKFMSDYITIVPGVIKISDRWVYYLGLATKQEIERISLNYETGVRIISQLLAGAEGERAITIGQRHSEGKANDIERATQIAENMVVRWGLDPEWGLSSYDPEKLSDANKYLKEKLVNRILEEGRALAEKILIANKELHLEMTRTLARNTEVKQDGLEDLYKRISLNNDIDSIRNISVKPLPTTISTQYESKTIPELNLQDSEVGSIEALIAREKQAQIAKAKVVKDFVVFDTPFTQSAQTVNVQNPVEDNVSCRGLF